VSALQTSRQYATLSAGVVIIQSEDRPWALVEATFPPRVRAMFRNDSRKIRATSQRIIVPLPGIVMAGSMSKGLRLGAIRNPGASF
jgi:hypothetical protein